MAECLIKECGFIGYYGGWGYELRERQQEVAINFVLEAGMFSLHSLAQAVATIGSKVF